MDENVETMSDTYTDLVKRGERLVKRIRKQESTQETVKAAKTTVTKAKTTRTQVTKETKAAAKEASDDRQEDDRALPQLRQGDRDLGPQDRREHGARRRRRRREGRRLTPVTTPVLPLPAGG